MVIVNCVQTTLNVLESIHCEPGWESSLLKDVEVPLRFLRTFFMCGKKWGRGEPCESFLIRIEQTLQEYVQGFQSTDGLRSDDHLQKMVSELLVCTQQSFLRELEDVYRTFFLGSSPAIPSSPSSNEIEFLEEEEVNFQEIEFLVDIMDSLLHNLQDLRHYNDFGSDSTAPVEDLEGYMRFLKNFILFATSRGLEGNRQMQNLLTHVQDLVLNSARLIFMCWYSQYRRMWYIVHQLAERIKPVKSQVFGIYVGVLQEASKSSFLSHHHTLGSHKLGLEEFVDSLLFLLSQLLFFGCSYGDIFNPRMQKLFQDLTFLKTFLRESISEEKKLDLIGAVICETGILICHLFTKENEIGLVEKFVSLEEKFKLIKAEEDTQKQSPMSASSHPRTSKLKSKFSVSSFLAPAVDFISSVVALTGSDKIPPSPTEVPPSIEQVRRATNNFSPSQAIGKGGSGTVYKAQQPDDQGTLHRLMTKPAKQKLVLQLDCDADEIKKKALRKVSVIPGIDSIAIDSKDKKLTIVGEVDPVKVVKELRKLCRTDIISVGPAKEPEKKEDDGKKDEGLF